MRETSGGARPGWIFVLKAIALAETFLLAVINSALAPIDGSWFLMAAKHCALSVWFLFAGGWEAF